MSFFKRKKKNQKEPEMLCVYAGPEYFKKTNSDIEDVYAGPEPDPDTASDEFNSENPGAEYPSNYEVKDEDGII